MICESCGKSIDNAEQISTEVGIVCQKCVDKSLGIHRCDVCGHKMTDKFGHCFNCGRINHNYKPADYVKSEDLGK